MGCCLSHHGFLFGFLVFTLYPIVASLYYSLCNYSVIKAPVFIGLQNYKALFQDKVFLKTISNTLYMMCLGVPIFTTIIAVGVSVMLNHKKLNQTYTGIIRVLFFPADSDPPDGRSLLALDLGHAAGQRNCKPAAWIHRNQRTWLAVEPDLVKASRLPLDDDMDLWKWERTFIWLDCRIFQKPYMRRQSWMVRALSKRSRFYVTIPLMKSTILYNVVTLIIGVLQWFAEPYIITSGGPDNSTMFYSLYLYNNAFSYFKMGYASAQAWIMLIFALLIILLLFKGFKFGQTDE